MQGVLQETIQQLLCWVCCSEHPEMLRDLMNDPLIAVASNNEAWYVQGAAHQNEELTSCDHL